MDDIIRAVSNSLPKYNKYLLEDYPERQVSNAPELLSIALEQATRLVNGVIKYKPPYRILTPEERAEYELTPPLNRAQTARSELILVAYDFEYNNTQHTVYTYMPYFKDHMFIIRGTPYAVMLGITERDFSVSATDIMIRVIRQPLRFRRTTTYRLESAVTGQFTNEFIVIAKLYNKTRKTKDNQEITVIDYLLAKFGLRGTLARFDLTDDDLSFVDQVHEDDTERYDYFLAKKINARGSMVYARVKKTILNDELVRKLLANILYTLSHSSRHSVSDLYDPDGTIYRIFIGELISSNASEGLAKGNADSHMDSVDEYLDAYSRQRLQKFGLDVNDIYDLLQYAFTNIDRIMTTTNTQSLYARRIEVMEGVMIECFVSYVFRKIYNDGKNVEKMGDKDIKRLIGVPLMAIKGINRSPTVTPTPQIYNGCWLIAFGANKIRLSGPSAPATSSISTNAPEARFHPSAAVVETLNAFSGKNPGITGTINPFLEITEWGEIIRPDYADDIDGILPYLPFQ